MEILLVDLDEMTLEVMQLAFEDEGLSVRCYANGQDAAAHLLEAGEPSLVFVDWRAPGVRGVSLLREVAESEHIAALGHCFFVTATLPQKAQVRLEETRQDRPWVRAAIIPKPFSLEQLLHLGHGNPGGPCSACPIRADCPALTSCAPPYSVYRVYDRMPEEEPDAPEPACSSPGSARSR